jgi:hypothetical protein
MAMDQKDTERQQQTKDDWIDKNHPPEADQPPAHEPMPRDPDDEDEDTEDEDRFQATDN